MTQEVLIQVIFILCNGGAANTNMISQKGRDAVAKENQEVRIACFEEFTNCAVGPNGKILTLKEFQTKCLKKESK